MPRTILAKQNVQRAQPVLALKFLLKTQWENLEGNRNTGVAVVGITGGKTLISPTLPKVYLRLCCSIPILFFSALSHIIDILVVMSGHHTNNDFLNGVQNRFTFSDLFHLTGPPSFLTDKFFLSKLVNPKKDDSIPRFRYSETWNRLWKK